MNTITAYIPKYDPVTFAGPDDNEGLVHRYQDGRETATACGVPLAYDHGVVGVFSTKPLCTGCWA